MFRFPVYRLLTTNDKRFVCLTCSSLNLFIYLYLIYIIGNSFELKIIEREHRRDSSIINWWEIRVKLDENSMIIRSFVQCCLTYWTFFQVRQWSLKTRFAKYMSTNCCLRFFVDNTFEANWTLNFERWCLWNHCWIRRINRCRFGTGGNSEWNIWIQLTTKLYGFTISTFHRHRSDEKI